MIRVIGVAIDPTEDTKEGENPTPKAALISTASV